MHLALSWNTEALNAHFMGCDAFQEGDLLVTFPGCKVPQPNVNEVLQHVAAMSSDKLDFCPTHP